MTLNGISYTVRLANGSMLQIGIKINKSGKYLALSNGNTPNQEQSLSEQSYTANTEIFFIYSSAGMQSGLLFIPN